MTASPVPRLLSLATAVPEHVLTQETAREGARALFAHRTGMFERLEPVFDNAQIETRRIARPVDWYLEPRGWGDANEAYLAVSDQLLREAAERALADAGITAGDVDTIVTISSTGIATPSLDARLFQRLPFRDDVQRSPIFGLGCGGGVLGIGRAAQTALGHAVAHPSRHDSGVVLLLVVELCSLVLRHDDLSKSNLVATALFGDGAAAAVIDATESASSPDRDRPRNPTAAVTGWGERTWPDTLDVMGWRVEDPGLSVIFKRSIPEIVEERFRDAADAFLAKHGLTLGDIDHFACHPGGAKVVDALESVLEAGEGALADTRAALRDYGNMSAVSVLFVLRRMMDRGLSGRYLMTALGPGFTAAFALLEA